MKLVTLNKKERNLLIFTSFAHIMSDGLHLFYPSLLFLIASDFNKNYFLLGILGNIIMGAGGVSGVIAGFLSDKYSSRRLFTGFALLSGIGSLFIYFSNGNVAISFSMLIFGFGVGIYHPVGLSSISRNIRHRTEALGVHAMVGGIGLSLAPMLVISLGMSFGWRVSFLVGAFLSFVVILLIPLIPKEFDKPKNDTSVHSITFINIMHTLTQKRLMAIYSTSILRQFAASGFMIFLATTIDKSVELETLVSLSNSTGISSTALLVTSIFAIGALGSYFGGKLGERFGLERIIILITMIGIPLLILTGLTSGISLIVVAALAALTLNSGDPILGSLIGKYLAASMQGKGFAILHGLSQTVGSFSGILAGFIAHNLGISWVFPIMAIFLLAALPIMLLGFPRSDDYIKNVTIPKTINS